MPSELDELSWRVSFADIRCKLKLRLSIEQLRGVQVYQAMAEVAAAMLGGKKDEGDDPAIPKTGAEAIAMFNKVMGGAVG